MAQMRWRVFRHVSFVWLAWERLWLLLFPVTAVRPGSVFAYRRAGDVLELHLEGPRLAEMRSVSGYSGFKVIHELREDLHVVANRVRSGELGWVKGIRGTSLMGDVGGIVGFEARALPQTLGNRLEQYFMVGLDAIYHPRGLRAHSVRPPAGEFRAPVAGRVVDERRRVAEALLSEVGEVDHRAIHATRRS